MKAFVILVFVTVAWGKPTGPIHDPMINEGLFEGDIMGIDPDADRNAVALDSMRWPGGVVPFVIDDSLKDLSDLILRAMNDIMKVSCIRFVPREQKHKHYIRLFSGNGCWSFWGLMNRGQQDVSLGRGCDYHVTVLHELLHAIGFEHEHNRSDRDDYLTINYDNIQENWWYAFKKLRPAENRLLSSFDFDSIMLYGPYAFSKRPGQLKSMEAKDGRFIADTHSKPGLSKSDIYRLNTLYECN